MDFATIGKTLARTEGVAMHLNAPDGVTKLYAVKTAKGWGLTTDAEAEGAIPAIFRVVGQDSATFRRRRNQILDTLRGKQKALKSDAVEHEAMRVVSAGIVGWEGIAWSEDGEPGALLEFTDENLIRFLTTYRPAFDQANEFIVDRSNFFQIA